MLAVASLVALGGCKSRQAENASYAPAEANVSENYPAENAAASTENNDTAEMNVSAGANQTAANNAAAATNNM